jgi:hypothetical protein
MLLTSKMNAAHGMLCIRLLMQGKVGVLLDWFWHAVGRIFFQLSEVWTIWTILILFLNKNEVVC